MAQIMTDYDIHKHKSKAQKMAENFQRIHPKLNRIEFLIGNKKHAVLLSDKQLEIARRKAAKKEMDLHEYYIDKYSDIFFN